MTRNLDWRRTLWLISLWEPPTSQIMAFPMMDDCGAGVIHVRMELGGHARVAYIPNLKHMLFIHDVLNDCAAKLMMESDWAASQLDLAGQAFEANVAGMGGRS